MKKGKGQMYSLIVIVIIITIVPFFTAYLHSAQSSKSGIAERIVSDQMHQGAVFIERDMEKAMEISVKRALFSAINRVVTNGTCLDNPAARIKELVENGTLYGTENALMENNTITEWVERILAVDTSFRTLLNYSNFTVENYDGFNLRVSASMVLNMSDTRGTARIDRALQKTVIVSVESMEDPVFPMNSNGFVTRIITECPYSEPAIRTEGIDAHGNCTGNATFDLNTPSPGEKIFVNQTVTPSDPILDSFSGVVAVEDIGLSGNVDCFVTGAAGAMGIAENSTLYLDENTHSAWKMNIKNGLELGCYYRGDGPDLLKRLGGDMSETAGNGMETFVSIPELEGIGMETSETQSSIEHLYFNGPHEGCRARGMPDWFRIDGDRRSKYNLTWLTYGTGC